jgi:PAS domain S-box-containing protein
MAKNIADLSANAVLTEDFASIDALLQKTAEFPDVLTISVTNARGILVSQVERKPNNAPGVKYAPEFLRPPADVKPSAVISGDRIVVWHPIISGFLFGWVRIEYSLQVITNLQKRIAKEAVAAAIPVVTVSTFLLLLFLSRHIRAVKKITDFAGHLKEQRGETIPVERSSLEIEQLMSALNHTSQKLFEQTRTITESEKKYRTIFEDSKDVIMIDTPGDRIIDINSAGVALFGYSSKDEIWAVDIANELYENPREREILKQTVARQGFIQDYEVTLKKKNGEPLTALVTATPVYDGAKNVTAYQGIFRDVTSERMLKDQLLHAQKMEAVGRLTGGIAHDFNNILSAVISYVYLLQKKMPGKDPLRTYVNQILIAVERAAQLTQGLLAFSRKQISNPRPVGLNEIIGNVEPLLRQVIGEDIELATALSDEDVTITADSGQVEQVLMNFAANARDAMPGGGRFTLETRRVKLNGDFAKMHGLGKAGLYALLSVSDTGTGMDESTVKKIFEPFFTTKEIGKGTGLGLSIVHGIVKQHNGSIEVSSAPGKGTTFTIYLPAERRELGALRLREQEAPRGGAETVLVADDDDEVRKTTRSVLTESGYTVLEAVDGEDAVKKFRKNRKKVALVLLDVIMPKKNGKEAYDEIKKSKPEIRAIFTSGYAENIIAQKGIITEGLHFIAKPVPPKELLVKVREILDAKNSG